MAKKMQQMKSLNTSTRSKLPINVIDQKAQIKQQSVNPTESLGSAYRNHRTIDRAAILEEIE